MNTGLIFLNTCRSTWPLGSSFTRSLFALLLLLCGFTAAAAAQECTADPHPTGNISVSGAVILRDGVPWAAKGVNSWGLMAPRSQLANLRQLRFRSSVANFKPEDMDEMIRFGADAVRFLLAQQYLDPESPHYTPSYAEEIFKTVTAARQRGLVVALVMGIYPDVDISVGATPRYASAGTGRAWLTLARYFRCDRGVIVDVFNEPVNLVGTSLAASWDAWRVSHQSVIDLLRQRGSVNPIMVEAMRNGVFAAAVSISERGSGYRRGDTACMAGGQPSRVACVRIVDVDRNGGVQQISITDGGVYPGVGKAPPLPARMTGGQGAGLKLAVTWVRSSDCADCLNESSLKGVLKYGKIKDSLGDVIYSIHIYSEKLSAKPQNWQEDWLYLKGLRPLLIGEWGLDSYIGCNTDLQSFVVNFLKTLKKNNISLFAWVWGTPDHIFVNPGRSATLTSYANGITCRRGNAGPGKTLHRYFTTGEISLE